MPVTGGNVAYEMVTTAGGNYISNLHAYFYTSGAPVAFGIYSDSFNSPGTLLGSTNNFVSVMGWNTVPLTAPVSLTSGTNIWFAIYVSGAASNAYLIGGSFSGGPGQL